MSGLPSDTSEDYLRLFFEKPRSSDGGSIDELVYGDEEGVAVITFKEAKSELIYYISIDIG